MTTARIRLRIQPWWRVATLLLLCWLLFLPVPAVAAEPVQLTDDPGQVVGDVHETSVSPDGQWVVYGADQAERYRVHLYATRADGSIEPVRLFVNTDDSCHEEIGNYAITRDSRSVVFFVYGCEDRGLFLAPIDGSGPALQIVGVSKNQWIENITPSPDSKWVVYKLYPRRGGVRLYAAPLDGAADPVKISGELIEDASVATFAVTPDSTRVVFTANAVKPRKTELFSVAIDGSGSRQRLNGDLPAGGDVCDAYLYSCGSGGPWLRDAFAFHDGGASVVYVADQRRNGRLELFSVATDGSTTPRRINARLGKGGDVRSYTVSPDEASIAYIADQRQNGQFELFSAPLDGSSAPTVVNGPLPVDGDICCRRDRERVSVGFSPDAQTIVYLADGDTNGVTELYAAPADASSAAMRLNSDLVDGGDVSRFAVSPDSKHVAFRADHAKDGRHELLAVPIDGSSPPKVVSGTLPSGGDVKKRSAIGITPDSGWVVYRADGRINEVVEVFKAPLGNDGDPLRLNPDPVTGGDVKAVTIADGDLVLYEGDLIDDRARELFSVPLDLSRAPVGLNGDLARSAGLWDVQGTADSQRLAYIGNRESGRIHLYSVGLDGSQPPVQLSSSPAGLGEVRSFALTDDSARAVYLANHDSAKVAELYSVASDGSTSPIKISAPATRRGDEVEHFAVVGDTAFYAGGRPAGSWSVPVDGSASATHLWDRRFYHDYYSSHGVSPDGAWMVAALSPYPDPARLYSMPTDGTTSEIKLHVADRSNSQIQRLAATPDSQRVVYTGDLRKQRVTDLYAVPIDGSSSPVRLSRAGGVFRGDRIQISPDSQWVVYRARNRKALFATPADGSLAPIQLNAELAENGRILSPDGPAFAITADSTRVVYSGHQDEAGKIELYSVPIDGTAGPVKLNQPVVGNADVDQFYVSPDSASVVYLVKRFGKNPSQQVFSAPIDGTTAALMLDDSEQQSWDAQITSDSSWFVYALTADRDSDEPELRAVLLDGSAPPTTLSGDIAGVYVDLVWVTADSTTVAYAAPGESPDIDQLYAAHLVE